MMRRLIGRFLDEQDGVVLVIAIAAMFILGIATTGVIVAGTANEDTAWVSTKARTAFATAQAALAYGEGMVYADGANGTDPPTTPQTLPTQANGATGRYTVSTEDDITWHVVATGTFGGVSRTVSIYVTPAQTVTTAQYAIWNYLYENSSNPNCITGGAVIGMPILSNGSMCVQGASTKILNNLEVNGNLTTSGNAQIGSPSSPISRLEITGTCAVNGPAKPPGTSPCDGHHNSTYAVNVGTTLDTTPTWPTVNFAAGYATQAGLAQTGCTVGGQNLLDNDTTLNDSNSTNLSNILFGSTAYDCKTGSTNEIKWTPSTKTLFVKGTFYFDGSYANQNPLGNIVYSGLGSFFFTGGFSLLNNGTSLCGIAGCGTGWDTLHNTLFLITQCWADGTGGLITSGCVKFTGNSPNQVGIYTTTNYYVGGNAGNMGPVLCDTWNINGGTSILIPIQDFPAGVPVPTTSVSYAGVPPSGWSG